MWIFRKERSYYKFNKRIIFSIILYDWRRHLRGRTKPLSLFVTLRRLMLASTYRRAIKKLLIINKYQSPRFPFWWCWFIKETNCKSEFQNSEYWENLWSGADYLLPKSWIRDDGLWTHRLPATQELLWSGNWGTILSNWRGKSSK